MEHVPNRPLVGPTENPCNIVLPYFAANAEGPVHAAETRDAAQGRGLAAPGRPEYGSDVLGRNIDGKIERERPKLATEPSLNPPVIADGHDCLRERLCNSNIVRMTPNENTSIPPESQCA